MSNVVDFSLKRRLLNLRAEKAKIVLASALEEVFAKYREDWAKGAACDFAEMVAEAKDSLVSLPVEMLDEYYWWCLARQFATKTGAKVVDQKFCATFDPMARHSTAVEWATTCLKEMPERYSSYLWGRE